MRFILKRPTRFTIPQTALTLCAALSLSTAAWANEGTSAKPDNSKVNKHIEQNAEINAQDQGTSSTDLKTTQTIRQNVVRESSLSTDAHNVKVITIDGRVVLKGPVKSAAEKKRIEEIATKVAGKAMVKSEITIAQ